MPDTIRISESCAYPWRRGFLIGMGILFGAVVPLRAQAEQKPAVVLHELVVSAQDRIDRHEIAVLVLLLGLIFFAVVTAIMLLRIRARWARLDVTSRDEIAALRSDLDRANALLSSEPQVMVDWPAGSDEPRIDGDPTIVGVTTPHRVLAFGTWLEAGKAFAMEQAVENLRSRGEGFSLTLTTLHGHPIELQFEEPATFALHGSPRVFAVLCWQLIRHASQYTGQGTVLVTVLPGAVSVSATAGADHDPLAPGQQRPRPRHPTQPPSHPSPSA